MTVLDREFYAQNTLEVAKGLLGCKLCRKINGEILSGIIVETEAYTQDDPACHAFLGKTLRSKTLFMSPGIAYVYFIYGMYHCLNFVTEKEDVAGAVLIRALEPIPSLFNTNGPGKLCRELKITRELNEIDVTSSDSPIWVEQEKIISVENITAATRIGIKKAVDFPWRFYVTGNSFVSRK